MGDDCVELLYLQSNVKVVPIHEQNEIYGNLEVWKDP